MLRRRRPFGRVLVREHLKKLARRILIVDAIEFLQGAGERRIEPGGIGRRRRGLPADRLLIEMGGRRRSGSRFAVAVAENGIG
jgi:hypothetical protein